MSHARYALSDDEEDDVRAAQPSSSYASVKDEVPRAPSPLPFAAEIKEETIGEPEPSVVQLAHQWLNERGAPEIQPWNAALVESVMDQIAQQQSILDSLASDASTSEEEHFRLNLVQLDVERAKWLMRSYLRARLAKIEKHAAHLMAHRSEQQRLSDVELGYARRYHQLNSDHFHSTVLQFLPEPMRGMQDAAPGAAPGSTAGGMVTAPNLDAPVFVYCREDCGPLRLPDGEPAVLARGTIHLLRYRAVRTLLHQRRVELL
ncbi:GINS complex subunit [Malassezia japonica]|uniref:DNA replication complex GINS protein SLD5 n=1 Tax=Malassezia japonica TaxID=223818 RepID=A0AAF0JGA1_9BASI|nr:GINS complex subunit [Malassezia japonica]WFD39751.1 GINS complex subunit [Malassezia japonica]